MNSRFYFLLSFTLLSACMPVQKPSSDVFIQSELMPPKAEEMAVIEEKETEKSILTEILEAIKAPLVINQQPPQQEKPSTQVHQQPIQQPMQPASQNTTPPIVLPQGGSNVMPQILQAAPSGGSSPFFQTIVLPQITPFGYPSPMPQSPQQQVQSAPFYSTPAPQNQTYVPQAPAQNLPTYPVNQPQQNPTTYPSQEYAQYQANTPQYEGQPLVIENGNNFYPNQNSPEVILPQTYQLPQPGEAMTHVMSGQEAYPVWQSEGETYYEEIVPAQSETKNPALQSENINIPRW